jgi:DnaK suppressor protein
LDDQRARALLDAERRRVQESLDALRAEQLAENEGAEEPSDAGDDGQRLDARGTDELIEDELRRRLDAVDRAERRLAEGTYGRSVRSGRPIPDDRLEADPAAELTVDEAEAR